MNGQKGICPRCNKRGLIFDATNRKIKCTFCGFEEKQME